LINRIVEEESAHSTAPLQLGDAALECLLGYRWPGNVRQLRHVLRYACAVCEGPVIQLADLPEALRSPGLLAPPADDIAEQGSSPERQTLIDALIRHRWKPSATAQALGISRATLYRRVRQHGIEMPGRSPA
jgi:transcriptional regulator of acetoin/glycerol metabolism